MIFSRTFDHPRFLGIVSLIRICYFFFSLFLFFSLIKWPGEVGGRVIAIARRRRTRGIGLDWIGLAFLV